MAVAVVDVAWIHVRQLVIKAAGWQIDSRALSLSLSSGQSTFLFEAVTMMKIKPPKFITTKPEIHEIPKKEEEDVRKNNMVAASSLPIWYKLPPEAGNGF